MSSSQTQLQEEVEARAPLDLYALIDTHISSKVTRHEWIANLITASIGRIICARRVMEFLNGDARGRSFEFVDNALDHIGVASRFRDRDIANIPASGRVIAIANHPLGGLDGLAILKMFGTVRRDVKIVVNDLLMHLEPLSDLLLPVDNMNNRTARQNFAEIEAALEREEAVIVFPAGSVSRWNLLRMRIRDEAWQRSFLRFAQRTRSPLLPIHVKGRNSLFFYAAAKINMNFSTLLLPRQLFNRGNGRFRKIIGKTGRLIDLRVGEPIPISHIEDLAVPTHEKLDLCRRNIYRIGRGREQIFKTEKTIIAPQDRQRLKQELKTAEVLGEMADNKKILIMDIKPDSVTMNEIGRLREIAFRRVGEGTGQRKDVDEFDAHYRHIIVWDEDAIEIAGAYRVAESWRWAKETPPPTAEDLVERLYSATLFNYAPSTHDVFVQGLELGRSFVQPRYWGLRALDYLWQGIGAYIAANPHVRYLVGPVSISGTYSKAAQDMLVWYYQHYFGDPENRVTAKLPFRQQTDTQMTELFCGTDRKADFDVLRDQLSYLNLAVPTLLKQYSELTEAGGMHFCAFNIDPDFNHCIDGLIIVDVTRLKPSKRKRYVENAPRRKKTEE